MSNNKGESIFGLEKIPTEELLKLAHTENGKLKAYIDELEYDKERLERELKNFTSLSVKEQNAVKQRLYSESEYKKQHAEIKELRQKINILKKDLEREMCKRLQLEKNRT